jgi:hypothetical protein
VQNINPAPAPTPPIQQTTTQNQTNDKESWQTFSSGALHFSIQYPLGWTLGIWGNSLPSDPTLNLSPSITNPQHPQQPIIFQAATYNCSPANLTKCMEDYYANYQTADKNWKFNTSGIKKITTSTGLTGVFYDDNQNTIIPQKMAMIAYPDGFSTSQILPNSLMVIFMRNYEGSPTKPISAEQSDIFMKIVNSFKFTK